MKKVPVMNKAIFLAVFMVITSFVVGISLYPQMPDVIASHWDYRGIVDGYMSKFWGIFLMPLVTAGILALLIIIPVIDPLKKNIKSFRKYYDEFIVILTAFLLYIYILTIMWNLGYVFNMTSMIAPAMGFLFYFLGILVQHSKRNWFIGIRTPCTLSSDKVWKKTHLIGGDLLRAAGIAALSGMFFPDYAMYFIVLPIVLVMAYTIVFSYLEYEKQKKN